MRGANARTRDVVRDHLAVWLQVVMDFSYDELDRGPKWLRAFDGCSSLFSFYRQHLALEPSPRARPEAF